MPQFNVAQLLKESVGATRSYQVDELFRLETGDREHLHGAVHLLRTDKGVYVSARLGLEVWETCARCLRPCRQRRALPIEEEFFPSVDVNTGVSLGPVDDDQEAFMIDPHHILDLDEAVRQALIVETPMKPLCREDCPGLCPTCGADRTTEACQCEGSRNPQWSALFRLLKE